MRYVRTVLIGAMLGTMIAFTLKIAGCVPKDQPPPQSPPGYKENPY